MKKLLSVSATCIGISAIFILSRCGAAAEVVTASCDKNAEKLTASITAFAQDPTNKTKCEAYKQTVQDFINSSCFATYGTAADRKQLQEDLKTMSCN